MSAVVSFSEDWDVLSAATRAELRRLVRHITVWRVDSEEGNEPENVGDVPSRMAVTPL